MEAGGIVYILKEGNCRKKMPDVLAFQIWLQVPGTWGPSDPTGEEEQAWLELKGGQEVGRVRPPAYTGVSVSRHQLSEFTPGYFEGMNHILFFLSCTDQLVVYLVEQPLICFWQGLSSSRANTQMYTYKSLQVSRCQTLVEDIRSRPNFLSPLSSQALSTFWNGSKTNQITHLCLGH